MKNKKVEIIKCPCCGAEYLPAEIYLPNSFLGHPTYVDRDHNTSAIDTFGGKTMDCTEHYICDYCNTPFKVLARVQFFTQEESEYNFNTEYASPLKKQSLFLDED